MYKGLIANLESGEVPGLDDFTYGAVACWYVATLSSIGPDLFYESTPWIGLTARFKLFQIHFGASGGPPVFPTRTGSRPSHRQPFEQTLHRRFGLLLPRTGRSPYTCAITESGRAEALIHFMEGAGE